MTTSSLFRSLHTSFSHVVALLCLTGLTACGGNFDTAPTATTATTALAAGVTHTPVADCEPQACQGLRIIDSNAETFRADSARRDALALAVAKLDNGTTPPQ